MVYVEVAISGPELARKLIEDSEEAAYGFCEMLEYDAASVGTEIAGNMSTAQARELAQWLTDLAASLRDT